MSDKPEKMSIERELAELEPRIAFLSEKLAEYISVRDYELALVATITLKEKLEFYVKHNVD